MKDTLMDRESRIDIISSMNQGLCSRCIRIEWIEETVVVCNISGCLLNKVSYGLDQSVVNVAVQLNHCCNIRKKRKCDGEMWTTETLMK